MDKVWQGHEGRRRRWLDVERTVVIFVATLAGHALWLEVIGLSLGAGVRSVVQGSALDTRHPDVFEGSKSPACEFGMGARWDRMRERSGYEGVRHKVGFLVDV